MTTTEQIVRLERGFPGGFVAGTVVRWINVTRTTPIPSDWRERCSAYAGVVPADVVTLDAADAAAAARADTLPVPAVGRRLTSQDLWRRFPWSKNPETFDRAVMQHEFPRPLRLKSNDLLSTVAAGYEWDAGAVDRWEAAARVRLEQLQELVGR